MKMQFKYNDGGRNAAGYKGSAGDCVARAIAIVAEMPYDQIYDALAVGTGAQRRSKRSTKRAASARNGINTKRKWFKDYMGSLGFVWHPTMTIGSGCTVHLSGGELPSGRLVVSVSKHYTAVIDGVIHDTFDPSADRGSTIYPPNYSGPIPKGAKWLANGNGWCYKPERCVYGYWSLDQ